MYDLDKGDKYLEDAILSVYAMKKEERQAFLDSLKQTDRSFYDQLVPFIGFLEQDSGFLSRSFQNPFPTTVEGVIGKNLAVDEGLKSISISGPWVIDDETRELVEIPKRVGNYHIEKMLGHGGMGQVLLARMEEGAIQRKVAMKLIKKSGGNRSRKLFEAEQQALANLNHPNIAHVYEVGKTVHQIPFFTMEYIEGETLSEYCDGQKLTIEARIELFLQICEGMRHAHNNGIIHRDLKPSNILVNTDETPTAKIIDFGIAVAQDSQKGFEGFQGVSGLMGTPRYMCPELILHGRTDTRSDIYSMGALLYEILSGLFAHDYEPEDWATLERLQSVVNGADSVAMEVKLESSDQMNALTALRSADPRALKKQLKRLDPIVQKAIQKDPDQRYQTVQELAEDLRAFLGHRPLSAVEHNFGYLLRTYVRRNRRQVFAFTSWFLVFMTGAFWRSNSKRDKDNAIKELQASLVYLETFLQAPDPYNIGAGGSFMDVFEKSEQILDSLPPGHTDLEISARERMGKTNMELAYYTKAEMHLERVVQLRIEKDGRRHPDTLKAQMLLARCLLLMAKYDDSFQLLEQTLKSIDPDEDRANYLNIQLLKVEVLRTQKNFKEAESLSLRLLELDQQKQKIGTIFIALANVYSDSNRWQKALDTYKNALKNYGTTNEAHPDVLIIKQNMGLCLVELGELDQAGNIFLNVSRIRSDVLSEDHPFTLNSRSQLARVWQLKGRLGEAESAYRSVLEDQIRTLGELDPRTLLTRSNLASLLIQCGALEEAEDHLEILSHIHKADMVEMNSDRLRDLNNRASMYIDDGQPFRAKVILEQVLAQKLSQMGEANNSTLITFCTLGQSHLALREFLDAEQVFAQTFQLAQIYQPHRGDFYSLYQSFYGISLIKVGKVDEGKGLLKSSKEELKSYPSFLEIIEDTIRDLNIQE